MKKCRWTWSYEGKFREAKEDIIIKRTRNGITLYKKQRPNLDELPTKPKSILYKPEYSSGNEAKSIQRIIRRRVLQSSKTYSIIERFYSFRMF